MAQLIKESSADYNALEVILIPTKEEMREGKRKEVNVQIDDSIVKRKTQQLALF